MNKENITEARRALLLLEIKRVGLTPLAKLAGKPARQISDMASGRKSFGDGVAKEIGPKIRPDLPREWLVYPDGAYGSIDGESRRIDDHQALPERAGNLFLLEKKSPRETRIAEIISVLDKTDETGLAVILHEAKKVSDQYPVIAKQTAT